MELFKLVFVTSIVFFSAVVNATNAELITNRSNINTLPQLVLNDLQGKQHTLAEWRGRVIILNFWATWCAPCQIEIPHLIKYQAEYADKGLQIVSIGLDEARKLSNYVRTAGINYPVLHADPQRHTGVLQDWGDSVGVLPYTVVINKKDQIVYDQAGIFSDEAFTMFVKPLLHTDPL